MRLTLNPNLIPKLNHRPNLYPKPKPNRNTKPKPNPNRLGAGEDRIGLHYRGVNLSLTVTLG